MASCTPCACLVLVIWMEKKLLTLLYFLTHSLVHLTTLSLSDVSFRKEWVLLAPCVNAYL